MSNHKTLEYYDALASEYDNILTEQDNIIRNDVQKYFKSIEGICEILDFGGGSGLDLFWQLKVGYKVLFYEPSEKMAKRAKDKVENHPNKEDVQFIIGKDARISKLHTRINPTQKVDAIFSNFAAINSISDLNSLFETFSQLLRPHGHIVCLLYKPNSGIINKFKQLFNIKISLNIKNQSGLQMMVHVHSEKELKSAAKKNELSIIKIKYFPKASFVLYHLKPNI